MTHWSSNFPWRLIQTNLPEVAMTDIDAECYVRSLKAMHATVAMINTSGIIASYKTALPFHFQSPYLQGDSLETIISVCHREQIRVVARTDFSKVRRSLYEQHPEWACVYPGRGIADYNGDVHCCINGDYQRHYAPKIIEETLSRLDVDGLYFNMGGYSTHNYNHEYLGFCQCLNCKARFRAWCGLELPTKADPTDPAYRKYQRFRRETTREQRQEMLAHIKRLRPDLMVDRATTGDFGFVRNESNTEIGRPLPLWQFSGSDNTKRALGAHPGLIPSNSSVDFIGFPYRHVAVSPAQQELRLWQALAACGGLDYYLIGRLDNHWDRSGFAAVERVFAFHEQHFDDTYRGLRPRADTLLIEGDGADYQGWYRLLAENHVCFSVMPQERLSAESLISYTCVVLANVRALRDDEARFLDDFVTAGGTLVATAESGFCDADGEPRSGCALKSLGIVRTERVATDMRSAMLEVMDKATFPSMVERDLLYVGDEFVFNVYAEEVQGHLRLIPPHPFGPPERCYWIEESELPGLTVNHFGRGKAIYLPWRPGTLYCREGHDNTLVFVRDVLTSLAGRRRIGGLSPMVEATLSEGADGGFTLLQLVNTSGHFGNTFHEPVTMTALTISVSLAGTPQRIVRLSDGTTVPFSRAGDCLVLSLDRLAFFEAVKICWQDGEDSGRVNRRQT